MIECRTLGTCHSHRKYEPYKCQLCFRWNSLPNNSCRGCITFPKGGVLSFYLTKANFQVPCVCRLANLKERLSTFRGQQAF